MAVRNAVESKTYIYLSILKCYMNLLIILQHYNTVHRAVLEDLHLGLLQRGVRGSAATRRTKVHTKFTKLLKDNLGREADER